MPTVAAVGTIVSAGVGVANAVSAKKAQKKQEAEQKKLQEQAAQNSGGIFGEKVDFEAPEYTPLEQEDPGYANIVNRILQGDLQNLPYAGKLSAGINRQITEATKERIQGWDPSFMGALATLQKTRNETLKGRLPYEDALAISADRGRLANDLGQAGGSGPQTAADLGMKRLDLMTNIGPNLTASIVNILNGVDPISRHSTPENFLLNPAQGVGLAIQDRQFGSEFNFNSQLTGAYLQAAPDPGAAGLFNLQAFQAGLGGGGGQNSGAAMVGAIGNMFSALGGLNFGTLFGGGSSAPVSTVPATSANPYIGNGGYVSNYNPASAYNPGGAASVPWAMGA